MNITELFNRYQIEYKSKGKNISKNWIGVCCPFCGDSGFHGGFTITKPIRYSCWRCTHKNTINALSKILDIPYQEAKKYLEESTEIITEYKKEIGILPFELPDFCGKLNERHKKYLENRKFDPDYLEKKFKLMGTTHLGNYRLRIIAPIIINGEVVSYQGRDITGKSAQRYKACNMKYEIVHHKHTLYNIDNAKKESVIVTEGITGVWRLGNNSVCTFGIKYTIEQAKLLCRFKKVYIFFDNGDDAQAQSEKLRRFLNSYSIKTTNITTDSYDIDSGDISKEEAKEIKKLIK